MKNKVLLIGESWITHLTHQKGFDMFTNSVYEEGGSNLLKALKEEFDVNYMPAHRVPEHAPTTIEELNEYKAIIVSDIGSNSFLLHPATFSKGERRPNRVKLFEEYVKNGGGFCMIGGYLTFQGIDGKGHWKNTAVEKLLPVELEVFDDREECPEGIIPTITKKEHPIVKNINGEIPYFLGYNRTILKDKATLIASIDEHPFIAAWDYGKGRSAVFTSDCSPHWGSHDFMNWGHYKDMWVNIVLWLSKDI